MGFMSTTCTIVTGPNMHRCGRPAVTSFTSARTGDVFAECEHHAVDTPAPAAPIVVGSRVEVEHVGKVKVGVVTSIRATNCTIDVPLADGRTKSIDRPIADVRAAR